MVFSRLALANIWLAACLCGQTMAYTLIDPTWWPQIVRYSQFSASSKSMPCPSPPFGAVVWDYINVTNTDTQANIYVAHDQKEILVVYPGTQSVEDRYLDLNISLVPYVGPGVDASLCPGCKVHAGFLLGYDSVANPINSSVTRAKEKFPTYDVLVVGHSLGGAYAVLDFLSMKTRGINPKALWTYGQPRVGNAAFANYTDMMTGTRPNGTDAVGVFYRHTHSFDAAPDLPPQSLGYRHSGTEFWELDAPYQEPNTEYHFQGQAANLTYRCYGQEPPDCSDSENKTNFQGFGYNNAAHEHYAGILYNDNVSFVYCGLDKILPYAPTERFTNITTRDVLNDRIDLQVTKKDVVHDVARKFKRWFGMR